MIPEQEDVDWKDPEQHFSWALRNMPMVAGNGGVTHPGIIKTWSTHLSECGFAHRDYLEGLADEDGKIHVSQLPRQTKKFQKAIRGPYSHYNNASRWVTPDTPDPKPQRLPDIHKLTQQEQQVMVQQFRAAGLIPDHRPQPSLAEEL